MILLNNPYQAYKQQSIMTMTPGDMLTALYDGILKEIAVAKAAFQQNDIPEINRSLQKVQRILRHLQNSLDFQYEIASSLNMLYDYYLYLAMQANIKKDPAGLDELAEMVAELRQVYIDADKKSRSAVAAG